MAKRRSIPDDPAAVFSSTANKATDKPGNREEGGQDTATSSTVKKKEGEDGIVRQRVTADVPEEIAEAARNAVYFTPGLTLRDLLASALDREVKRLEKEQGKPFPQREKPLKRGRRA